MNAKEQAQCERFKEVRNALNIKQGDFAKELAISQGHASDIENGRKTVSDRAIEIISLKYNVNADWLRTGEGEMFEQLTDQQKAMKYTATLLKDADSVIATAIKNFIVTYEQLDDTSKKVLENVALKYLDNMKRASKTGPE